MGSGRGAKKQEQAAEQRANTAFAEYKADPLEEKRRARTMKFLDEFDSGTDVKDMEALSPYYNLFQNARNAQANQQVGRGVVALGRSGNTDAQVSDLDKYVQAQREQNASGMLYDAANQGYSDAVNESQYLINTDQARKQGRLGMAANMYQTVLNRPTRPPLWERLLGMGIQAGQAAATAFGGGA